MARHSFGGDIASWVITAGSGGLATLLGGVTVTMWNAQTGGAQYTNLALDSAGSSIVDHVSSSTGADGLTLGQIPQFWGPDGISVMWASANGGPRELMVATDVAAQVAANVTTLSAVQSQVNAHVAAPNPHATKVSDLTDTAVAGVIDAQVLAWSASAGKWQAVTVSGVTGNVTLAGAQTITGPKTFGPLADVNASRILMYAELTGQVANLFEAWSANDTGQGGARQRTTYLNEKGELRVIPARFDSVAVRIKAQPGQTAHITEWTDTGNNVLSWVEGDGRVRGPNLGYVYALSISGNLTVGTGKHRIYNDTGGQLTIRSVRASVGTAPVGASIICDVLKNGASVFTVTGNRPAIAAGANTSGKVTAIGTTTLNDGDYLTVDVAQIGSSTPGADLVVQVLVY
jgi:hypothetical protein